MAEALDTSCIDWSKELVYDEASPSGLRWVYDKYCGKGHNRIRVAAGDVAGYLSKAGRWRVCVFGRLYLAHRIIFQMFHGHAPRVVDHEDGNSENNTISNLRGVTTPVNMRNVKMNTRNKSGVTGVSFANTKGCEYWRVDWVDLDGTPRCKSFSIKKLGSDVAFTLAVEFRSNVIGTLNENGAGYTERHGK